jgi:hypothetical protein
MKPRISAFTLIEVLVSLTICMAITGTAFGIFRQFNILQLRIQARITMHQAAMHLVEVLGQDIATMHQGCAVFAEGRTSGADKGVKLAWMSTRMNHKGFRMEGIYGFRYKWTTDLGWVYWTWNPSTGTLSRGNFYDNAAWVMAPSWNRTLPEPPTAPNVTRDFKNHIFYAVPQPRRLAQTPIATAAPTSLMAARLADNAWGSTAPEDHGDWHWLSRTPEPILRQVEDFAVEIVRQNGNLDPISSAADVNEWADGIPLDGEGGLGSNATPAHKLRPQMIRIRFTLADHNISLRQNFSFSFTTPGTASIP